MPYKRDRDVEFTMVSVGDVMTKDVVTIDASKQANEAAKIMADKHVGCLIVTSESNGVSIITERDLVWKITAEDFAPSKVFVSDVMTAPLITISSDKSLEKAAKVMTEYGVRRLPVVDKNALVGIITASDLAKAVAATIKDQGLLPVLNAVSRAGKGESGPYG